MPNFNHIQHAVQSTKPVHIFVQLSSSTAVKHVLIKLASFLNLVSFLYCWLHWIFITGRAFSSYRGQGCSLLVNEEASHCGGFSSCRAQTLGHRLQQLHFTDLAVLRQVESSWTREFNMVPCISRWIVVHWATAEVLCFVF